ncbi:DUF2334 domain-containing protein [Clostridium sp.]|uniref:DUF2334 domain-containing protein n=1 Tax=Clostridium sp. TaxID=1506 RepID=UPI002FCA04D2
MKIKKLKKGVKYSIIAILVILVAYGVTFYFSFFQGNTTVTNGQVESKIKPKEFQSVYTSKVNLDDSKLTEVKDVKLSLLGKNIPSTIPVLLRAQRYYVPLNYIASNLGYTKIDNNDLDLKNGNTTIKLSEKEALINGKKYDLRGWLPKYNNEYYIGVSDIEHLFSLTAIFDFKNNSIKLLKSNYNHLDASNKGIKDGPAAMIRLEDFASGGALYEDVNQTKLKAMGDYLSTNGVRFHIAWVPRYINPDENFDNDLLKNTSINNVGFVNLLDYMINSGAEIGLHGYTHQSGDSISLSGIELSSKFNPSEKETRTVIENGLKTADELNIPVNFFESPHYQATRKQKEIIGEYFKYLYEPYSVLYYTALKETDKGNVFIPTPLSYVKDRDVTPMVNKINNPPPNFLASLFYHPTLELEYIDVNNKDNTFNYTFSSGSLIKPIVEALNNNGYSTIHVTDLN